MPYSQSTWGNTNGYDEHSIQMLSNFLSHINQTEGSSLPESAAVDLKYIHDLQQQRLKKKQAQIRMHYDMEARPITGVAWKMDNDTRYVTRIPFHIVNAKIDYVVNGRIQKHIKEKQNLYGYVIWLLGQNADMSYCCPNCGAPTMTSKLVEGCPYCGTRFLMQELFPKITNYYTLSSPTNDVKYIKPFTIAGAAAMFLFYCVVVFGEISDYAASGNWLMLALRLFQSIFAVGAGALIGYMVSSLVILAHVISQSIATVPHLVTNSRAKKQLPDFMRQFEPNFSLDHFVGKLISIINILVYSDDLSNCALYGEENAEAAKQDTQDMADIIDMHYCGYLENGKCWVDNGYAYVNLIIDMDDIYCQNGHIRSKKDKFKLLLCKNIHAETDYGFSIHAITCPSCGGSFDVTKVKSCPYCGVKYNLRDYDWVVLDFQKSE